jgi:TolB protein
MPLTFRIASIVVCLATAGLAQQPQQPQPQPPPQQPTEIETRIGGQPGLPPRYAVPDFIALSNDRETVEVAKTIAQVLFDDLNFEREFYLIPRDTYKSIPAASSYADIPFDRWKELGTDGLVIGTVSKTGSGVKVEVRLFNVATGQSAFGREYTGAAANPRLYAHTISDEIHQHQRALRGVARTKLTFVSDRDGERIGGVFQRGVKEIYIADYDGANQRRVTVQRTLNITPVWSADARSIAYTSYRRDNEPQIFISHIFKGLLEEPTTAKGKARGGQNWLPSWSPDGTRIAFTSNRDGNPELYVMNADGTSVRRITKHPAIDTSPTWSPAGNQIAFTSDRSGAPQIYTVDADGLGTPRRVTHEPYCDRPTWAPAPFNEIAYASRTGPGLDVKVMDLSSGQVRQLTFGEGTNESPSYSPTGRHLAFMSTRKGFKHIFVVGRDGKGLKQITTAGNNEMPNWSR